MERDGDDVRPQRGRLRAQSVALKLFSLTPAGLFHRIRTTPVVGDAVLSLLDALLPKDEFVLKRVRRGPLAGMTMKVDPRAFDMVVGGYEVAVQATLESSVAEGDIAFDVGANLGYFSLLMAKVAGPAGRIVSFEPDPVLRRALNENLDRNPSVTRGRVVVVGAAVGAGSGRAGFTRGWRPSRGTLVDGDGDLEVEVTTLDAAAERYGVPAVIKVDVEGAEVEVLRGAPRLLAEVGPTLLVETHSPEAKRECGALLQHAGYTTNLLAQKGTKEIYILARR